MGMHNPLQSNESSMALTKERDGVKGELKHDSIWIPWRSIVDMRSYLM